MRDRHWYEFHFKNGAAFERYQKDKIEAGEITQPAIYFYDEFIVVMVADDSWYEANQRVNEIKRLAHLHLLGVRHCDEMF